MTRYDPSSALDDLFDDEDGETTEQTSQTGAELDTVTARTEAILDARPTEPVDLVMGLTKNLPDLGEVQAVGEGDTSELTETEQRQKGQTENVVRSAVAAGEASVWVIAEALQRVAKGRWWRQSHATYEEYVTDLTGRSASYVRRLRASAPLALETAARTGLVPNPGQAREALKVEQQYGRDAAIVLFQVVAGVTEAIGDKVTAETVSAVRQALPATLPDVPEQQRAEIERATHEALGQDSGVPIGTPEFESESNSGVPIGTPGTDEEDDEVLAAEIVPDSIVALQAALKTLTALNRDLSKQTFAQAAAEGDPEEYADLRAKILAKASSLQKKALRAPAPP